MNIAQRMQAEKLRHKQTCITYYNKKKQQKTTITESDSCTNEYRV